MEDQAAATPRVLFLCTHNSGRSQMAAGFMRVLAEGRVEVFSAGSEPADSVNFAAVAAMTDAGIDISGETPQRWTDDGVREADVVVTMGCGDTCPVYPGPSYVDWGVEDPAGRSVEQVILIRDDLERRVRGLLSELGVRARD